MGRGREEAGCPVFSVGLRIGHICDHHGAKEEANQANRHPHHCERHLWPSRKGFEQAAGTLNFLDVRHQVLFFFSCCNRTTRLLCRLT